MRLQGSLDPSHPFRPTVVIVLHSITPAFVIWVPLLRGIGVSYSSQVAAAHGKGAFARAGSAYKVAWRSNNPNFASVEDAATDSGCRPPIILPSVATNSGRVNSRQHKI